MQELLEEAIGLKKTIKHCWEQMKPLQARNLRASLLDMINSAEDELQALIQAGTIAPEVVHDDV